MSAFGHLDDLVPLQLRDGLVGRTVEGAEAALAYVEIEPGVQVPEHQHVNEQTGILLSGSMTFRVGAEERTLTPGATWVIPADVPHAVEAGPDGARLVELFAPPRSDWGNLPRLDPSPPAGFGR